MDTAYSYLFDNNSAYNNVFESNSLNVIENMENYLRRPRIFKERKNYYEEYDDMAFRTRFRLSKRSAMDVLEKIEHKLEYSSDRNNSISPINQLLLTLRYYATGAQQITMGDYCGASKPTSQRIIHRVTAAIASLSPQIIRFPETQWDMKSTQLGFYNIAKFPKALGALDCTHVRIRSPGGTNAEFFRNRKGYMSINVQAIGNANLEITDMVARWPGSSQDQTIWNACSRNYRFERGLHGDSFLLADSGNMNRPYVMMPLENLQSPEEHLYNKSQIRSRNTIERLFGVWKRRFAVLALGMQIKLHACMPVIIATAVLHNLLRKTNEDLPRDDEELLLPAPWVQIIQEGMIREQRNNSQDNRRDINPIRRSLINNYFKSLRMSNV